MSEFIDEDMLFNDFINKKNQHVRFIQRCMELADIAKENGDIPVAAIIVDNDGNILAEGINDREKNQNPIGHAEINAIKNLSYKTKQKVFPDLNLYVNLEPCTMCAAAIIQSRISKIYFGAWDIKAGGCGGNYDLVRDSNLGSPVEVYGGICEKECSEQLRNFFESLR